MIKLSPEFRNLATKIYTFSFIYLAVKILKITSFTQSGLKIEVSNAGAFAGALAIVTAFLTISALCKLVSDWVATQVTDELHYGDGVGTKPPSFSHQPDRRLTFSEARFNLIRYTSIVSFLIEAALPLCVGVFASLFAAPDMVEFLSEIAR